MKLSKIKYSFSEAKKNVTRNGLMSLASLFTISCCLIILGVFSILSMNVNEITSQIKDQCEIQLYINANTDDKRVKAIGEEILSTDNVKEAVLFTKKEMLAYAKNDMFDGNEALLEGFDEDNPFSDSYKIILEDIKSTKETVEALTKIKDVEKVVNKQDLVNVVLSISSAVKKFSIAVMLILFVVAVVIISNTVKLTVFNRRKEINIMKYIGATDRFIRVPFVLEGLIIGFAGAVFSFILVFWGYFAILRYISKMSFSVFELLGLSAVTPVIIGLFICVGCLIGVIGSTISMRKYLQV